MPVLGVNLDPDAMSVGLLVGEEEEREITVENLGESTKVISLSTTGEIGDYVEFNKTIVVGTLDKETFKIKIRGAEKGLLTGSLVFESGGLKKVLPIVINVRTENFLFDVEVSLLDKTVILGDMLKTQVNLLQVGPKEKVDVVANYLIKDFEGNKYLEEHETFFVLEAKDYVKEFSSENLDPGKYVVGLEIVYPGAFATSSAQFEVTEKASGLSPIRKYLEKEGIFVWALLIFGGIVIIGLIWWFAKARLIRKKFRKV